MGELRGRGAATLHILDKTGDTKVMWNPRDADEVRNARLTFDDLTRKGFRAFRVGPGGEAGQRIADFDADAEKIILIPQLAGG